MIFVNNTPLEAILVPNAEASDDIAALVVASITYRFVATAAPESALRLAKEQRPLERGIAGEFPGDDVFVRRGVSIGAIGFVHAPGGEARRAEAKLVVGAAERTVVATGPRVWQRGALGALTASAPRPFQMIAMTWANAFGGGFTRPAALLEVEGKDLYVPEFKDHYPLNAEGIGYYRDEKSAENQPLPLLEDEAVPVTKWSDRPAPLAFAPYATRGGLRALAALTADKKVDANKSAEITHRFAPRLGFSDVPEGTRIALSGMRASGEVLAFDTPHSPAFVEVDLEGRTTRVELALDTVEIDAHAGHVRLVYRNIFRYPLLQEEIRVARIEGTDELTRAVLAREREA